MFDLQPDPVKNLRDLLDSAHLKALGLSHSPHPAFETLQIQGLTTDSRTLKPGDLFIGLPGTKVDGGRFAAQALDQGAAAVLVAADHQIVASNGCVLTLPQDHMYQGCGQLAAAFFDWPSTSMAVIGVTGTNGKTTTSHLIEYMLKSTGDTVGLIGTLYNRWADQVQIATHTTPFSVELQRTLYQMQQAGCRWGVMEVSSHSLAQHRVWGCQFERAVWTNLTQDHLDFHPSMEAYWQAKATLFQPTYLKGRAVINGDDPGGLQLIQAWDPARIEDLWIFSRQEPRSKALKVDLWPTHVHLGATGITARLHTPYGELNVSVPMVGAFNLANLLAAVGAVLQPELDLNRLEEALRTFPGVPGRMERVTLSEMTSQEQDITVIVDYAHTPDGLDNLLQAARPLTQGRLWCVFGCGGDRDRTKRPKMGQIAANGSDQVVVTSDNPRTEDPQQILQDIFVGLAQTSVVAHQEMDRRAAIMYAISSAQPGDIVVIAGKGHEDYQILGTTKVHFDDREVAREALLQRLRS